MICAAGCSVSEVFGKLMEDNGYTTCRIDNFEYLSGGGMKGIIDGGVVICGKTELMRLMNVRVPYRLVGKTSVFAGHRWRALRHLQRQVHPGASGAAGADKSHPLRPTPDICDTRLQYQPRKCWRRPLTSRPTATISRRTWSGSRYPPRRRGRTARSRRSYAARARAAHACGRDGTENVPCRARKSGGDAGVVGWSVAGVHKAYLHRNGKPRVPAGVYVAQRRAGRRDKRGGGLRAPRLCHFS